MTRCGSLVLLVLAACVHEDAPQTIVLQPPNVVLETRASDNAARTGPRSDAAHVEILPTKRTDRPARVVGVVDAHVEMGDHARALSVLREKAAELGADAVIGVELAHGEGHQGAPIHLSGLAIRYLNRSLVTD